MLHELHVRIDLYRRLVAAHFDEQPRDQRLHASNQRPRRRLQHTLMSVLLPLVALMTTLHPLAAAGNTVITDSDLNGWLLQQEAPTGNARFAAGPGTPPSGDGSLLFNVNAGGRMIARTAGLGGTRLDAFTALSYQSYTISGPPNRTAALRFDLDDDLTDTDGSSKGQLTFQPGLNAPIVANQWQPWDAGALKAWILEPAGPTSCEAATPCTLAELLAALPNAGIAANGTLPGGGFALVAAGAGGAGMEVAVDMVTVTVGSVTTVFDFELVQCTTVCFVDAGNGDDTFSGSSPSQAKRTIGAAVAQVSAGGDVIIAAGLYPESDIAVDKAMSLAGISRLNTLVDGGGATIFNVSADNVSMSGLTLQNGSRGVSVPSGAVANLALNDMRVRTHTVAGVEVGPGAAVTGLTLDGTQLSDNQSGLKLDSAATANGVRITRSIIQSNAVGLLQTSNGVGNLRNLQISDTTFIANSTAAISLQGLLDGVIQTSTFDGNGRGFVLEKTATTSLPATGGITVRDNAFVNQAGASLVIGVRGSGLSGPLIVRNNDFTQPVNLLSVTTAVAQIKLGAGTPHAAVTVDENVFTLTGARPTGVAAVYALQLGGSLDAVAISDNVFVGNGVGSAADLPATAALYLQSNDAEYGSPDAATVVTITRNTLGGFVNGVAIYNPVAAQYGGLPEAAVVTATRNNIAGNSGFGAANGAGAPLQALSNWWGAATGPGAIGPGTGDKITAGVLFCPWLDAPAPGGAPVTLSGSVATTSADNYVTEYCTIEEALFASNGANQTVRVGEGTWPPERFSRDYRDSPNARIVSEGERAATILTGVRFDDAIIEGLTFDNLTLVGTAPETTQPYSVVIDTTGIYQRLAFTNNVFDGRTAANQGAIYINQPSDGITLTGNQFRNYGPTQSAAPALITIRTDVGRVALGGTIRDNDFLNVPHAQAIDFYRWGNIVITDNRITGGGMTIGAPPATETISLGATTVISNQITLADSGTAIALTTLNNAVTVDNNQVAGAQTCVAATGVKTLTLRDNTLTRCAATGLRFDDDGLAPETAAIEGNTFITMPVGIENAATLTLDVCNNFFDEVATTTKVNPGEFTACPVVIEKFEDVNFNGQRDAGEPGLPNWEFTIAQDDAPFARATTDADGVITLDDLDAGEYEVCETLQVGWINTTDVCQLLLSGPGRVNRLRFGNVTTGAVVIRKIADPSDGATFNFTTTIPEANGSFDLYGIPEDGAEISATLPISASNIITFENVPTGVFTVTETAKTGWLLSDLTCDDPTDNSRVDFEAGAARINVGVEETVTCTFSNAAGAGFAILKETQPSGLIGPFTFEGDLSGSVSHGGRIVRADIIPGEYTVTEVDIPPGFALSDIRCDDEDSRGDLTTNTATFIVDPQEFVTCVFVNTLTGIDVAPTVQVSEEGDDAIYNITLATEPNADVTIEMIPDVQVATAPISLTIAPENWLDIHAVTVRAVDDGQVESAPGTFHTGRIRHAVTSEDPFYNGITIRDVIVAIVDNDFPGVTVAPTVLPIVDETEPLTYTLQLASRPADAVAIGIETGPELETIPAAVLFTAQNWNQPQTILVLVAPDSDFDAAEIVHVVRSVDPIYNGLEATSVLVTRDTFAPGVYLPLTRKE